MPTSLTLMEPTVVHPGWLRLLRSLQATGMAREIRPSQLRARLDYHAAGPPKQTALLHMLSRYYTGDGDPARGHRRRRAELDPLVVAEEHPLRQVA